MRADIRPITTSSSIAPCHHQHFCYHHIASQHRCCRYNHDHCHGCDTAIELFE